MSKTNWNLRLLMPPFCLNHLCELRFPVSIYFILSYLIKNNHRLGKYHQLFYLSLTWHTQPSIFEGKTYKLNMVTLIDLFQDNSIFLCSEDLIIRYDFLNSPINEVISLEKNLRRRERELLKWLDTIKNYWLVTRRP